MQHQPQQAAMPDMPMAYARLFDAFNREGIVWCSWKSNEHLGEGLDGRTDIDFLFRPEDRALVMDVFAACDFIPFTAPHGKSYPGILDAVRLDAETQRPLHAHAHFMLCLGEKYLKGFVLPWSGMVLNNRVQSAAFGAAVYESRPVDEMILLLLREALKLRWRTMAQDARAQAWGGAGFNREWVWLKERVSADEVRARATICLNAAAAEKMSAMREHGVTLARLAALRRELMALAATQGWRRMGRIRATMTAWLREALWIQGRVMEKLDLPGNPCRIRRRVLPGHGYVVAFVGVDGSGKSTMSREIVKAWAHKVDVRHIYMGTGDGAGSLMLSALKAAARLKAMLKKPDARAGRAQGDGEAQAAPPDINLKTALWAVAGMRQRRQRMRQVARMREKGLIVVTDRWPQAQRAGLNDGPLLRAALTDARFAIRVLARWEDRVYGTMLDTVQPDSVIRMDVTLDTALRRRPENEPQAATIQDKITALAALSFAPGVAVHAIDANKDLPAVRQAVFDAVCGDLRGWPHKARPIVEFFGLPGSGKSTICRALQQTENAGRGADTVFGGQVGRWHKILQILRALWADPVVYGEGVALLLACGLWRNPESVAYIMRLPDQKYRMMQAARGGQSFVLEQFLLQNVWSAFVAAGRTKVTAQALAPFLRRLYRDMDPLLLVTELDSAMAAQRVAARAAGTSRFDGHSAAELQVALADLAGLTEDIVKAAEYAGLYVRRVRTSQTPADAVAAARAAIG